MSEVKTYAVPSHYKGARNSAADYERRYQLSVTDPEAFWAEEATILDWMQPFTQIKDVSFNVEDFRIRWYADGALNVSANCLDRHLKTRADKTAIIWEGDNPAESRNISYRELHDEVCRFAGVLKAKGVKKGDRVTIYMPMIPEAAVAMLACTRIGAVHSVVFGGFSPDSLAGRIEDCQSTIVITADEGLRGGRAIPLKANVDNAIRTPAGSGSGCRWSRVALLAGCDQSSSSTLPWRRSLMPALRDLPRRAKGAR